MELKSKNLNTEFAFSALPNSMLLWDSLLIVTDSYTQDKFIHIFHKENGNLIKSIGARGQGPGELTHPISTSINKNTKELIVYSFNSNKIIKYSLDNITDNKVNYKESKINNKNGLYIADVIFSENGDYVRGIDERMRFGLIENGNLNVLYNNFPKVLNKNKIEEDRAVMNYSSMWRISPDGKKLVQATYIGGIIEIFYIHGDHIHQENIYHYFYPKYRIVEGATPLGISWIAETVFGFQHLWTTNNSIYILVNGGKASENSFFPQDIAVLDWSGEGGIKFHLDNSINIFAVDEDMRIIYAITYPKEGDEDTKLVYYEF
ncbi:MAG: TolB-like 6-bladed beta-propeller domain-containing protein [Dysgonamonadaceae bacterium]|nr:TolB-like 6-bladed beta-propeller domain-containing protein [Dysgonamonadaceae bacterium]